MNIERLKEVLSIQTVTYNDKLMFDYLVKHCEDNGFDYVIEDGSIYVRKGIAESYPCIVAHMDTVHSIVEDLTVVEVGQNLTGFNKVKMEQTGIGGDDKVGIFIALECLEHFDNIKVVFFRDEESGCDGSYNAMMDFFLDCRFVLQCDRKGNKDFVTNASGTKLSSKAFKKAIGSILSDYGYSVTNGLMTDVMALKEMGLNVAAANISCGYYNPHMDNEYVNIPDVFNCLAMVVRIMEDITEVYFHKAEKKSYFLPANTKYETYSETNGKYTNGNTYWDGWDDSPIVKKVECDSCLNYADNLVYASHYNMWICDGCDRYYRQETKAISSKAVAKKAAAELELWNGIDDDAILF